jgi:hypothetical protein
MGTVEMSVKSTSLTAVAGVVDVHETGVRLELVRELLLPQGDEGIGCALDLPLLR